MDTFVVMRRVVASAIDGALVLGMAGAIGLQILESVESPATAALGQDACARLQAQGQWCVYTGGDNFLLSSQSLIQTLILLVLVPPLILKIIPEGVFGRTVGKLLLGIRVQGFDGDVPGVARATVRWLFLVVDTFGVGLISIVLSPHSQRVGDRMAGTYVVRNHARKVKVKNTVVREALLEQQAMEANRPSHDNPEWDKARNAWVYPGYGGHLQVLNQATGKWLPADEFDRKVQRV